MGIKGLTQLLADNAPNCMKEQKFDNYFGRKVAVDASMHIYQFMAVVGRMGESVLTSETGEVTAHLQGMFSRTIRMMEAGIKPIYVFDGKPPDMKGDEITKRREKAAEAEAELAQAKERGDAEAIEKLSKRSLKVTKEHNNECKTLLRLMGVPVVEAPCEAEAQCSSMCKAGLVYGVATEDMDALTFGCPKQLRHLMAPTSQKIPIQEFEYAIVLKELGMSPDEFIDLCILLGCDYLGSIKGVGPKSALKLIQEHKTLEAVVKELKSRGGKYTIPELYEDDAHLAMVRELFRNPEVTAAGELPGFKWTDVQEQELVNFLVGEKSFSEDRVRSGIKRLKEAKGRGSQGRMDSFFKVTSTINNKSAAKAKEAAAAKGAKGGKRKAPAAKGGARKK